MTFITIHRDSPPHTPRVGVLLSNLGTPDGTGYAAIRRYLGEFLSDRRIIEANPLIWKP
ncbi:MAG: ferrochelatase, partial [Komagataeibacter hansenii]|nr:ferrochelatase [Novacetimonas hansenii]